MKNKKYLKWGLLIGSSLIWGTAFLWTKKSLVGLTPFESSAGRIFTAGLFFLFLGLKNFIRLPKKYYIRFLINGLLGTTIPIIMFSIAQTRMDSGITAVFNSITPLFVAMIAFFFMKYPVRKKQWFGIFLGWVATIALLLISSETHPNQNYLFAAFVFVASLSYGFDMNLLKKWYKDLDVFTFTSGIFIMLFPLALFFLIFSGFFEKITVSETARISAYYVFLVGFTGSLVAKLMFNKLIQIESPVFASTVTYLIPLIAVGVGILDGEKIHIGQILTGLVLLYAVYLSKDSS